MLTRNVSSKACTHLFLFSQFVCVCVCVCLLLVIQPRASRVLSTCSVIELQPQPKSLLCEVSVDSLPWDSAGVLSWRTNSSSEQSIQTRIWGKHTPAWQWDCIVVVNLLHYQKYQNVSLEVRMYYKQQKKYKFLRLPIKIQVLGYL
jgi:hypothetical protein